MSCSSAAPDGVPFGGFHAHAAAQDQAQAGDRQRPRERQRRAPPSAPPCSPAARRCPRRTDAARSPAPRRGRRTRRCRRARRPRPPAAARAPCTRACPAPSALGQLHRRRACPLLILAQAEVEDLDPAVGAPHDVLGLEIAMDDAAWCAAARPAAISDSVSSSRRRRRADRAAARRAAFAAHQLRDHVQLAVDLLERVDRRNRRDARVRRRRGLRA